MTEPKRHPHADVLIAIAEGREVQCMCGNEWIDYSELSGGINPLRTPEWQWRVKPQKQKMWVNVYQNIAGYPTKEAANECATPGRIACIEIEFEEGDGL